MVQEHSLTETDMGWTAAEFASAAFWVRGSGISPTLPGLATAQSSSYREIQEAAPSAASGLAHTSHTLTQTSKAALKIMSH